MHGIFLFLIDSVKYNAIFIIFGPDQTMNGSLLILIGYSLFITIAGLIFAAL